MVNIFQPNTSSGSRRWKLNISLFTTPNIGLTLISIFTVWLLYSHTLCSSNKPQSNCLPTAKKNLNREPRVCKRFYGITQYIQGYGVGLQEGVRVRRVQQRAELFPCCLSKGVAELLCQFLWRVNQHELFFQGAAPQLHPQLKLRLCVFTTV